jgi:hydroxypyruvate isomerase
MPRFAANLTMLFTELPFMQRFAAAAKAGFTGVEYLFPYAYDKKELAAALRATACSRCCTTCRPATGQGRARHRLPSGPRRRVRAKALPWRSTTPLRSAARKSTA